MATGTERFRRGERAGKRVRLVLLADLALFAPALLALMSGHYSRSAPTLSGMLFILLLAIAIVRWGLRPRCRDDRDGWAAFLGGLGALTAVFALVEQAGALGEIVYPAIYALLAFLVSFNPRRVSAALVGVAIAIELVLSATAGSASGRTVSVVAAHIGLILLFGGLHWLFDVAARSRRLAVQRAPRRSGGAMRAEPATIRDAPDGLDLLDKALALIGSAFEAEQALLLELDRRESVLRVVAAIPTEGDHGEVDARAGIVGSVVRTRQPVVANHLRADFPGALPRKGSKLPSHVLGAPVGSAHRLRGVLLIQRTGGEPFDELDLDRVKLAGRLLNASLGAHLQVERVTNAHYELEQFFDASRQLNSALTPDEVYRSANQAIAMIADTEMSAITWIDDSSQKHRLVHAQGCDLEALVGQAVLPDRSLASMVIKNGHYLPLGCEHRTGGAPVVSAKESLAEIRSLVVLPLRVLDRIQGTLAIGSVEEDAFFDRRRGMLEVIANQVGVSLANALTYARVQEMATVDALTGLHNRRAFHSRLEEAMARSRRSGQPLSLILLDIDHFKRVNDTHGHPVGDEVLARLGATIRQLMRRTDTAARYGGEEFALVLEDTSSSGALVMAERLRQEAAAMVFAGAEGKAFSMTLSLGIAAHPLDATDPVSLVQRADDALYEAKHKGRNQSRLAQELRPAPSEITEMSGIEVPPGCPL